MNITTAYLERALSKYPFEAHLASFQEIAQGKENTSIKIELDDGNNYLLRFWGQTHSYMGVRRRQDIEAELDFMHHCYEQGIKVPKAYDALTGNNYEETADGVYFAIMDYIPGEMPSSMTPAMIGQIAQAMANMHKVSENYQFPASRSWPGSVIEIAIERLELLWQLPIEPQHIEFIEPIRTAFLKAAQSCNLTNLPKGPIHGDIFWENIKFQDGSLQGIYDFDDCRDSYFLEDITKTLTIDMDDNEHGFFGDHGDNIATFIEAYETVRPLDTNEKQLLPLFLTANFLSRLARYLTKTDKGILVYQDRVAGYCDRYEKNKSYFLTVE